jgi:DNA polymerase
MFIGEAPGATEAEQGLPFVGRAGKLLNNMIRAAGLERDEVFIANITKHRPPNNRKPTMAEMQACLPFLYQQIEIIEPKVIVALGNTALEGLTDYGSITKRCGKWENLDVNGINIMLMPCFHPSALLRNPNWKEPAKKAMREVRKWLGIDNARTSTEKN